STPLELTLTRSKRDCANAAGASRTRLDAARIARRTMRLHDIFALHDCNPPRRSSAACDTTARQHPAMKLTRSVRHAKTRRCRQRSQSRGDPLKSPARLLGEDEQLERA